MHHRVLIVVLWLFNTAVIWAADVPVPPAVTDTQTETIPKLSPEAARDAWQNRVHQAGCTLPR